ncbi:MAG: biotin/lipoyl-containing protein [Cytophagaceae bacterium]
MLNIEINNKSTYSFREENDVRSLNDQPLNWDLRQTGERTYHIIHKNKSYNAELVSIEKDKKNLVLKINNYLYTITIKDQLDELLEKMGLNKSAANSVIDIKAPMPGLILDIKVSEGDEVKKGDPVVILEAMKMENILKSPGDGVVSSIKIKKGESVEKNQILIQF